MNRLLSTLLCGWALLLYPLYSIAESYELSYSIIGTNQKIGLAADLSNVLWSLIW